MPTELDVYAPERWVDDALFRPEVREAYPKLLAHLASLMRRAEHRRGGVLRPRLLPTMVGGGAR
jgi:hypothetical protein